MAMGLVFVPALLILLVLLLVVAIRITPWISWKLSKPQVSWAEGVEIAYPLDPLEASELQGPCGTEFLKSHKSSEQLIVQLDPSHRGISCPVLRSNQSDAVITVGVPPSYPNAPENIE